MTLQAKDASVVRQALNAYAEDFNSGERSETYHIQPEDIERLIALLKTLLEKEYAGQSLVDHIVSLPRLKVYPALQSLSIEVQRRLRNGYIREKALEEDKTSKEKAYKLS